MVENELFQLLKDNLIPDLISMSAITYSDYDAYTEQYDSKIELKCRLYFHKYDDYIIEKDKYDRLMKYNNPTYINSIGDELIYSWHLDKIQEPVWLSMNCPKTSYFTDRSMVSKLVGYLPISQAKDLSFLTRYLTK